MRDDRGRRRLVENHSSKIRTQDEEARAPFQITAAS
jgi:hypothetical protein